MKHLSPKTGVVILAAGHGTRMKSEIPKVMHELHGKPMIGHMVDAVISSGVTPKPVVVVSLQSDLIRAYFGNRVEYAIQEKQLGTAHATAAAEEALKNVDRVLVLYGDLPLLSAKTIENFTKFSSDHIVMGTTTVLNFDEERKTFFSFGRVIRNEEGAVINIREKKDCSTAELTIKELNTGLYSFPASWLFVHVKKAENNNAQQEYYLTDVIFMAMKEGIPIDTVDIPEKESFGISSQEDLKIAQTFM